MGTTLLVLTSGYNRNRDANGKIIPHASSEYVFVFDITSGAPVQKQVIQVPNTYSGIAFSPDGAQFYVSGGKDDSIHTYAYAKAESSWAETGAPVALSPRPYRRQRIAPRLKNRTASSSRTRCYSRRQDPCSRQLRKRLDQLNQYAVPTKSPADSEMMSPCDTR
jgi:DNA-binding beta-propeller fold protein YncE